MRTKSIDIIVFATFLSQEVFTFSIGNYVNNLAGIYGSSGYNGDGIDAKLALLNKPTAIVSNNLNEIIFADMNNNRIRKILSNGTIFSLAGTGSPGFNGDGIPAISAQLNSPRGVSINSKGEILIADTLNNSNNVVSDFPSQYVSSNSGLSQSNTDPMSRYSDLVKIGSGGFGSVFKVIDTKSGNETKALKVIRFDNTEDLNMAMREGIQLLKMNHPNILKVNDFFIGNGQILCIDMIYYEKGDLNMLINGDIFTRKANC